MWKRPFLCIMLRTDTWGCSVELCEQHWAAFCFHSITRNLTSWKNMDQVSQEFWGGSGSQSKWWPTSSKPLMVWPHMMALRVVKEESLPQNCVDSQSSTSVEHSASIACVVELLRYYHNNSATSQRSWQNNNNGRNFNKLCVFLIWLCI